MYCVVRKLIEIGEDVNMPDGWGYTPLVTACIVRRDDIAKLLIDNGADVNTPSLSGLLPLDYACSRNAIECVRLLADEGAEVNYNNPGIPFSPLFHAVAAGGFEVVKELVLHGADPRKENPWGTNAIKWAYCFGRICVSDDDRTERQHIRDFLLWVSPSDE